MSEELKENEFFEMMNHNLRNILEKSERDESKTILLLQSLLIYSQIFFEYNCSGKEETYCLYKTVSDKILNQVSKGQIESNDKAMAIGQFVDGLVYFNFARKPAIEAVAKWLGQGESTVRTYNEVYRKKYGKIQKHIELSIALSPFRNEMLKYIHDEIKIFPSEHVNSSQSFQKLKKIYEFSLEETISSLRCTQ